jgi:hypothetical protein
VNKPTPKREPRRPWTPEEDELLRWHGPKVTLQKLQKILQKELGVERSIRGITQRRRRIDPTWTSHLGGVIPLAAISGLGAEMRAKNPRAFRQAKADGVLQHRLVYGRKTAVVPLEWADGWIAAEEQRTKRHAELRDAGWLYTTEIAKILKIPNGHCIIGLRNLSKRNGAWRPFRNVESAKIIGKPILWEPTGTRTAIAAYLKTLGNTRTRTPKGAS